MPAIDHRQDKESLDCELMLTMVGGKDAGWGYLCCNYNVYIHQIDNCPHCTAKTSNEIEISPQILVMESGVQGQVLPEI